MATNGRPTYHERNHRMEKIFLPALNRFLRANNFPISGENMPDYIAARKAEDPNHEPPEFEQLGYYSYYGKDNDARPDEAVQTDHYWNFLIWHPNSGVFDITVAVFPAPNSGLLGRVKVRYCEGEDALDNDQWQRHGWDYELLNVTTYLSRPESIQNMINNPLFYVLGTMCSRSYTDRGQEE